MKKLEIDKDRLVFLEELRGIPIGIPASQMSRSMSGEFKNCLRRSDWSASNGRGTATAWQCFSLFSSVFSNFCSIFFIWIFKSFISSSIWGDLLTIESGLGFRTWPSLYSSGLEQANFARRPANCYKQIIISATKKRPPTTIPTMTPVEASFPIEPLTFSWAVVFARILVGVVMLVIVVVEVIVLVVVFKQEFFSYKVK